MSCRQAEGSRQKAVSNKQVTTGRRDSHDGRPLSAFRLLPTAFCLLLFSVFHICHLSRPQAAQELRRLCVIEFSVARFDQEKEAVARGERKVRRVEDRVIRFGQTV